MSDPIAITVWVFEKMIYIFGWLLTRIFDGSRRIKKAKDKDMSL